MASVEGKEERSARDTEALHRVRSRRGMWMLIAVIVVVAAILSYGALSGWFKGSTQLTLQGAGATFPAPLISKWASVYNQTGVRVNYQPVGSGTGITSLANKAVDFAASDAPLQASDRTAHPSLAMPNVLHIPETIGSVTFAYNLAGISTGLNVTGDVLVKIFRGNITTWNDPGIQALNPGVVLPSTTIIVVHRSDSSGTTFVWTSYLHKSNATLWNTSLVGKGGFTWPTGVGQNGNTGVAAYIRNNPNTGGYVELAYTVQNGMTVAKVKNPAGNYILPTLNSTTAAAANAVLPTTGAADWANVSILNAAGANSYPISSLTYLLVYKELNTLGQSMTLARAQALVNFLWWVVHDGQNYSASLTYVPLPSSVVALDVASIQAITYNGQTLHS
jgi:phosphate transport system substrate-binding protein